MESTDVRTDGSVIGIALAIAAALVAVFLSIFALGRALASDPAGGSPVVDGGAGAPSTAAVSLVDIAFSPNALTVAEGGTIRVTNEGAAVHNLTIRDADLATEDLLGGASEDLSLAGLAAGSYQFVCTIAGHEAAGMTGTLQVVAGDGSAAPAASETVELSGMAKAEALRAAYEESVSQFPAETEALGAQVMTGERQPDGSLLFELTLDEAEWEVAPGEFVHAVAYNGQVPGPTMKVGVGETITLRVINELDDQYTTIHPHGIFMHPFEVDGVGYVSHDPTGPGETYEVTFETKEPSVGMYHGHDNGVHQVINGAFGAWIVGDVVEEWNLDQVVTDMTSATPNIVGEKVMVLNDAGEIGLTLNAKSFPATEPYVMKKGEQMVLHYYNEGLTAHPMHLHNNAQLVFAKDGYPLEQPYFADTINVAPGERYSVLIFAEVPGVWVFHCHILTHVEKTDGSVFGMFTALIVEDSGDPELDADTDRQADARDGDDESTDATSEESDDATSEESDDGGSA